MTARLRRIALGLKEETLAIPGLELRFAVHPITNAQLAEVLNAADVLNEWQGGYRMFNGYNTDVPLRSTSGGYEVRSGFECHPATAVSWFGARLVTRLVGARLPTTTEWEAAANPLDLGPYPWGDARPVSARANYDEHVGRTTPIGSYAPNPFGLYDMAGNVGEWCTFNGLDGSGTDLRVSEQPVKGGGWNKPAYHLRSSFTRLKWARIGTVGIGFRLVFTDRSNK